jgi:dTDP-4-amino-4,6-dideoxygalactose transaminase
LRQLADRGVACGIHYPIPIHLQQAYAGLGLRVGSFPVAERCAQELLSLPMFPELTSGQIQTVVTELKAVLSTAK